MIGTKLSSPRLSSRVACLAAVSVAVFFGTALLSHFLLPEGLLLNKNSVTDFDTSSNLVVCSLQIFAWNMISVACIAAGAIFARKRKENEGFVSLAYWVYLVGVLLAAITLGTASFTGIDVSDIPIVERMLGMLDITKSSGLIEICGQMLAACALSNKYLVMTFGSTTTTRRAKDLEWTKGEITCLVAGLLLTLAGAFVEGSSMLSTASL